jgi:hypothetical protein
MVAALACDTRRRSQPANGLGSQPAKSHSLEDGERASIKVVCPLHSSQSNEAHEWLGVPPSDRRGSPIRAGWNSAAEVSVQTRESANSFPMLDIPG